MSRPIVVLRPEPGARRTLAAGRVAGVPVVSLPYAQVVPCSWTVPDAAEFDALLVGSANAFRHGGPGLEQLTDLPVHAVGAATAQAATDAGFVVTQQGEGGLQALLDALPPGPPRPLRLLRLSGEAHVPLDPPQHIAVETRVLYRLEPQPLDLGSLAGGAVVLLHSAGAATHFAQEIERQHLDRSRFVLAALGSRILADVGAGWGGLHSAARPDDSALLELAAGLCDKQDSTTM